MSLAQYSFSSKVWLDPSPAGWHFITVPTDVSLEIRARFSMYQKNWGTLRVTVKIGATDWQTSIFWDSKAEAYFLPVKATVRKKEQIKTDQVVGVGLEVSL